MYATASVVCVEENVMEEVGEVVGGRGMLSKWRGKLQLEKGLLVNVVQVVPN